MTRRGRAFANAFWGGTSHAYKADARRRGCSGRGTDLDAAGPSAYGVFLNEATDGKMDSFLDVARSAETPCDGESVVRVTLSNTADAALIESYPMSMTGGGL